MAKGAKNFGVSTTPESLAMPSTYTPPKLTLDEKEMPVSLWNPPITESGKVKVFSGKGGKSSSKEGGKIRRGYLYMGGAIAGALLLTAIVIVIIIVTKPSQQKTAPAPPSPVNGSEITDQRAGRFLLRRMRDVMPRNDHTGQLNPDGDHGNDDEALDQPEWPNFEESSSEPRDVQADRMIQSILGRGDEQEGNGIDHSAHTDVMEESDQFPRKAENIVIPYGDNHVSEDGHAPVVGKENQ